MDIRMPEVDGIEFLASIRGVACTKILLTGAAGETEAVDAFNAGLIDFYLKKTDAGMTRKLASMPSSRRFLMNGPRRGSMKV